jgi:antagonist of KipI
MRGAQLEEFGAEWRDAEYTVSAKSDRMGVRLSGLALRRSTAADLLSMAVAPGTVQVPPDGQPIVLLADAQTIGGYPQLAHVITVDVPLLAQLRPGDAVRFVEVTQAEARRLNLAREQALGMLREGLAQKFR